MNDDHDRLNDGRDDHGQRHRGRDDHDRGGHVQGGGQSDGHDQNDGHHDTIDHHDRDDVQNDRRHHHQHVHDKFDPKKCKQISFMLHKDAFKSRNTVIRFAGIFHYYHFSYIKNLIIL